jgi:hypothetical protein
MFFKKKDALDENTIVLYAITVAQIFQDSEDKFGTTPADQVQSLLAHIKKDVLKGGNVNPDDESLQHLDIMCTSLALDESGFMSGLRSRFSKGDRSVGQDDIQKALNLAMKYVQEFVKAANKTRF